MDLIKIDNFQASLPKTDEDASTLLATLHQIQSIKKKFDEQKKKYIEIENDINKVLKSYLTDKCSEDEFYKLETEFGSLSSRKSSEKWIYDDEKKLINQLKAIDPSLIRIKEEIDKTKLKKNCTVDISGIVMHTESFEDLEGVHVEFPEKTYSVTTKKGK